MKNWLKATFCAVVIGLAGLGFAGCTTKDLETIEFRYDQNSGYVQYWTQSEGWNNINTKEELMSYIGNELKGERGPQGQQGQQGIQGEQGVAGINGKQVEFNVSEAYIQWRYEGETHWRNLVALSSLKGADGEDYVNKTYTVTFDYNDAGFESAVGQTIDEYFDLNKTENLNYSSWLGSKMPTFKGTVLEDFFEGWVIKDTGRTISAYDVIGGDITLQPKWRYNLGDIFKSSISSSVLKENRFEITLTPIKDITPYYYYDDVYIPGLIYTEETGIERVKTIKINGLSGVRDFVGIVNISYGIEEISFGGLFDITDLFVPSSCKRIYYELDSIKNLHLDDIVAWNNIYINNRQDSDKNAISSNLYLNGKSCSKLIIPEGVTTINQSLTQFKNVTSVEIPTTATKLNRKFEGAFKNLFIKDLNAWCNLYRFEGVSSNYYNLYLNNVKVEDELVIPSNITAIKQYAFDGVKDITTITFNGGSFDLIGRRAFYTKDLNIVNFLPYKISFKEIHGKAFPNEVLKEETEGFYLSSKSNPYMVFMEVKSSGINEGVLTLNENTEVVAGSAAEGYSQLTSVKLPNGLKRICEFSFNDCANLESLDIPDSIEYIGRAAFQECDKLQEIIIPSNVSYVGDFAFANCSGLTTVILKCEPIAIVQIGREPFIGAYLTQLSNVTIENKNYYEAYISRDNAGNLFVVCTNVKVLKSIVDNLENINEYLNDPTNYTKTVDGDYYIYTKVDA